MMSTHDIRKFEQSRMNNMEAKKESAQEYLDKKAGKDPNRTISRSLVVSLMEQYASQQCAIKDERIRELEEIVEREFGINYDKPEK